MTLPRVLACRIEGQCCYSGCTAQALDGSDFCGPHDAHERGRAAGKQRRRRMRLAADGLCITGCGARVAKKRKPGGGLMLRACAECRKAHRERMKDVRAGRAVPGDLRAVPGAPTKGDRIASRTIVDKSGRTRYLGKQRRGAPAIVDADHDDFTHARAALKRAEDGLDYYKDAKAAMLPRIQLEDLRQAYVGQAFASARILLELCQRAGWTIPGLNDDEIAPTGRKDRG